MYTNKKFKTILHASSFGLRHFSLPPPPSPMHISITRLPTFINIFVSYKHKLFFNE